MLVCFSSTEVPCLCGCSLMVTIEGSSCSPKYHSCTIFLPGSNSIFLPEMLSSQSENSEPGSVLITTLSPVQNSSSFRSEEHRLNSSHSQISYAVFCLKKKKESHSQR